MGIGTRRVEVVEDLGRGRGKGDGVYSGGGGCV